MRAFQACSVQIGDKRVSGFRLICKCGADVQMPRRTYKGRPDDKREFEDVIHHFSRLGWVVGSGEKNDMCPKCANAQKRPALTVVPEREPEPAKAQQQVVSETPDYSTAMVIIEKLKEVYQAPETGYFDGWSDASVAKDMGCCRAWVTTVRRDIYGKDSVGDNEDARKIAEEAKLLVKETLSTLHKAEMAALESIRRMESIMAADVQRAVREVRAEVEKATQTTRFKLDKIEKELIALNRGLR